MSRRREDDEEDDEEELDDPEDPPDEEEDDDEDVEYFVLVEELWVSRTSVPKSVQSSHSSSSAPSTFVVVSEGLSAPHISHWGIHRPYRWRGDKTCAPGVPVPSGDP